MADTEKRSQIDSVQPNYYLVVDVKGTSDDPPLEDPPEVIELALVAVDAHNGEVIGDFQRFVRPEANPELSPHCVAITGISQAQIDQSDLLEDVLEEANRWVQHLLDDSEESEGSEESNQESSTLVTVTYGLYAMKDLLLDQIDDEELEVPSWAKRWVNLQRVFKRHFAMRHHIPLDEAFAYLGLTLKGKTHSAIDDAHSTAQILTELIQLDARMEPVSDQKFQANQGSSVEEKPGDWRCDRCQFLNFARRHFCKDCGNQRTDGVQPPAPVTHMGNQEAKPGDWHCDRCSFMNFARRNSCKNCSAPRPGAAAQYGDRRDHGGGGRDHGGGRRDHGGGGRDHGGGGRNFGGGGRNFGGGGRGPRMKPGDWRCGDCSFVNFARREFCKDCGGTRPADVQRNSPQQGRPGDWNCSGCNYFNFAYREVCGQCGENKSDA